MKERKDVAGLINALKDDDATVRYHAVQALDKLRDLRAVGPLTFAIRDDVMPVRARAAEALGRLADGRAADTLVQALDDESANVRYAAATALGAIGVRAGVEPLIRVLRDDADNVVRVEAARSLGVLDDIRAAEPLINALHDERDDVRNAAADALTALLGERAQRAVKLHNTERDRRDAEQRGEVTPRAHKQVAAFCSRWCRDVTLLRGFYSFFDVCEGSLAYVAKPCENYHCLYHDLLVSGFWLRNKMGVTDFTAKADAYRAMRAQGAIDCTRRS
jgi:HEAT repeat protein